MDSGALQKVVAPFPFDATYLNERDAVARAMALNHINNDLKRALQQNGIGRPGMWKCIGKIVDQESRAAVGPASGPGLDLIGWLNDAWNVSQIRDQMRAGIGTTHPTTQP